MGVAGTARVQRRDQARGAIVGLFDKLFGRKRPATGTAPADAPRARVPGAETAQTTDEQQATRRQMEAEMNAQRERRSQTPPKA